MKAIHNAASNLTEAGTAVFDVKDTSLKAIHNTGGVTGLSTGAVFDVKDTSLKAIHNGYWIKLPEQ